MAAQSCTWLPGSTRSGMASDLPQHSTGRSSPSITRVPKRTAESEGLPSTESNPPAGGPEARPAPLPIRVLLDGAESPGGHGLSLVGADLLTQVAAPDRAPHRLEVVLAHAVLTAQLGERIAALPAGRQPARLLVAGI